MRMWARPLCTLLVIASVVFATPAVASSVVIGTGSIYGVYFQVGRGICQLVTSNLEGVDCSAVPTAGSLFNLDGIRDGVFEIGVVQSDWQYHAVRRTGPFANVDRGFNNLRALFSVHGEPFTLVARRDSGIRTLDDLVGRRVNIGNPGSGQRATMQVLMEAKGWTEESFELAEELPASQQSLALCNGRIEAMVYTVGHPNKSIADATDVCDAVIVEVSGREVDKLVADHPYYSYTTIPGELYKGNPDPVKTFGIRATVVADRNLDEKTAYGVVKTVFENLDEFRKFYPAFGNLKPEIMATKGLTAPLHRGAESYFREKGLPH